MKILCTFHCKVIHVLHADTVPRFTSDMYSIWAWLNKEQNTKDTSESQENNFHCCITAGSLTETSLFSIIVKWIQSINTG